VGRDEPAKPLSVNWGKTPKGLLNRTRRDMCEALSSNQAIVLEKRKAKAGMFCPALLVLNYDLPAERDDSVGWYVEKLRRIMCIALQEDQNNILPER
jgi:hypothetical protein